MKLSPRSARPALFNTLSVLLPTEEQTWLLRACLHSGEKGRQAWAAWQEKVGDPKRALAEEGQAIKGLLPLLYRSLQSNGAAVNRDLMPYLRTAYFREELRSQTYRRICSEVLAILSAAEVPLLVLEGAALAETVYEDGTLRHSGTLDLLLQQDDLRRTEALLTAAGLAAPANGLGAGAQAIRLEHESGLPVILRAALFSMPYYQVPLEEMWQRSVAQQIAGVPAHILSPADALLHVCGVASSSKSREMLQWVCDSWYIVRCLDLDWDVLIDGALRCNLALPLSVLLGYLADELDAPIPRHALHALLDTAARTSIVAREAALSGARAGSQGTMANLLAHTDSWLGRAIVLKWRFLPSPTCLRWTYRVRSSWLLPLYYVYRPLTVFTGRLRSLSDATHIQGGRRSLSGAQTNAPAAPRAPEREE